MTRGIIKAGNIRKLYQDGMPIKVIAAKLNMAAKTIRKIVADIPNPHEENPYIFIRLGQIRKHGNVIPLGALADVDDI